MLVLRISCSGSGGFLELIDRLRQGGVKRNSAPLTRLGSYRDRPAIALDDLCADGEADTCSGIVFPVRALEDAEDPLMLVRGIPTPLSRTEIIQKRSERSAVMRILGGAGTGIFDGISN